ncbi:MAG: hemin receptor [Hyphomicrobiaceae bacterium]|nr:hemin receptor [Hyphomicrobiaceae bacterium]MCC0007540.1 hemin receptor [Hyphomicrobiaceae bacterium]
MTPDQIELVQSSFAKMAPLGDDAGRIFYGRLFNIAPEVKRLFHGDLEEQAGKLMHMLGIVVANLKDLDTLLPTAQTLAKRHVDYGVEPQHYALVGEALLWTLGDALGESFNEQTQTAWKAAYGELSAQMISAAYDEARVA